MNRVNVGDRVSFRQAKHMIPMSMSTLALEVHDNPQSGEGMVQFVSMVGTEMRVFVLPDNMKGKKEQITLLLRIPPDTVQLIRAPSVESILLPPVCFQENKQ